MVSAIELPLGAGDVVLVGEGRPAGQVLDLQGTKGQRGLRRGEGVGCPSSRELGLWGVGWDGFPCTPCGGSGQAWCQHGPGGPSFPSHQAWSGVDYGLVSPHVQLLHSLHGAE